MYGATLLDVTPTVLTLFGLPVADDMQGRVLAEAFERPAPCERIPSWESVPGECGMHPVESRTDALDSTAVLQQLVALGYVDGPAQASQETLRTARTRQAFNLARVHLSLGNPAQALPLMEEVTRENPKDITLQLYLAQCYYEAGRVEDCCKVGAALLAGENEQPAAQLLEANLRLAEGRSEEALALLLAAGESARPEPQIRYLIGCVYLKLARWDDAERHFERCSKSILNTLLLNPDWRRRSQGEARWNGRRKPPRMRSRCGSICRTPISR